MKIEKLNRRRHQYYKWALVTITAIYVLILVGGIVRSSGSGMGCPDWPKCFGSWVPPTSADELPADYKEVYSQKRGEKNIRFAKLLDSFGAHKLANEIRDDESILEEADFNVVKTWIEYINRLVGVTIGLFIIGTFALSFKIRKQYPTVMMASFAVLVLVIFQGWLGSVVVSTNLLPWLVTVHMLPALLIVALLIWAAFKVSEKGELRFERTKMGYINTLLIVLLLLTLIQIIVGTQVRENVDEVAVANGYLNRGGWIGELGGYFYFHRSFSILMVLLHLVLFFMVRKSVSVGSCLYKWTMVLLSIILLEIISGVIMAYFAIPAFFQPIHLLLGTLLFGVQYYMILLANSSEVSGLTLKNSGECSLQEAGR